MREKVLLFGTDESLAGIMTEPVPTGDNHNRPAIILLNAGLLHRIGPNRLYVTIARRMAAAGFLVFRFDLSGIGDSVARSDSLPFVQSSISETKEAMDYLSSVKGTNKFILIGICSGADLAFRAACRNPCVVGVIGINGSYCDGESLEELNQHVKSSIQSRYYRKHFLNYRSWWRVITGKSDLRSIRNFLITRTKSFLSPHKQPVHRKGASQEWRLLAERKVDLLLVYSEGSSSLDVFHQVTESDLCNAGFSRNLEVEVIEGSDHVFTLLWSQRHLVNLIHQWAQNKKRVWSCE